MFTWSKIILYQYSHHIHQDFFLRFPKEHSGKQQAGKKCFFFFFFLSFLEALPTIFHSAWVLPLYTHTYTHTSSFVLPKIWRNIVSHIFVYIWTTVVIKVNLRLRICGKRNNCPWNLLICLLSLRCILVPDKDTVS